MAVRRVNYKDTNCFPNFDRKLTLVVIHSVLARKTSLFIRLQGTCSISHWTIVWLLLSLSSSTYSALYCTSCTWT